MITFSSDTVEERNNEIFESLPLWKTHVLSLQKSAADVPQVQSLQFLVNIKTRDEFAQWLKQYQELSKTTYSIRSTEAMLGKRIVFKQRLQCQHNTQTKTKKMHDPTASKITRNTNCPSKMMVKIHAVYSTYKGKDKEKGQLYKEMPCEIDLVVEHNHSIESASALRYRRPSSEVQEKLISLFNKGHSPASALNSLKVEIQLNCPDFPFVLADRNRCPDYKFCYSLYMTIFKKKYGPMDFNKEGKIFLQKMLDDFNNECGTVCAKMFLKEEDYVICICSPLMKRVHEHLKTSSRVAFMDSTGSLDHDGSRLFVLLTHSYCGGLPLGIIITSSESCEVIEVGLQLLKDIVGGNIFGGSTNGPKIFLTDDSQSEQNAIGRCFPHSKVLLCVFHVLQAVWRWLIKAKNGIPQAKQCEFFQNFKEIMYAKTKNEAIAQYNIAKANIGENHQNYLKYLEGYWERRHQWAISYRTGMLVEGHNTNNISEAFMRIMKDKIFERTRAFNVVQLVEFILTKINMYFQRRLLDTANRPDHRSFSRPVKVPSQDVLQKIKKVNGDIVLVPSEDKLNHYYIVNLSVLICTCVQGNTGKICKHIDWASTVFPSRNYIEAISNTNICSLYYLIAMNEAPPKGWLEPLYKSPIEVDLDTGSLEPMEVEEVKSAHIQEELADTVDKKSIEEGIHVKLQKVTARIADFAKRSPEETDKGVDRLLEALMKTKTPSAFSSLFAIICEGKSRKNRGNYIAVQPTAISRRKKKLVGRRSYTGGRPRSLCKQNRGITKAAEICDMRG